MQPNEREVLAARLKAELQEFRERERIYVEKRQELQDLEKKYRKKQDQIVANEGGVQDKINTNDMIIDHLKVEINEL